MHDHVIIGCGYVGERLARRLPGRVACLARDPARLHRLRAAGLEAFACDLDALGAGAALPVDVQDARLFYLAPPPGNGPDDPRLRGCLGALGPQRPDRFVYVSTTGVYGDAAGATVDEDTIPAPSSDRARARLDAEQAVRDWCEAGGVDWTILRVPGIYGPGRLPLERIRRGDPMIREAEAGPGNRIHVDDLVAALVTAAASPRAARRLYNAGDGDHASTTTYLRSVARLAGLPTPPELPRDEVRQRVSPAAWSFMADSRRVDCSRMWRELELAPAYPDLESALRASLAAG